MIGNEDVHDELAACPVCSDELLVQEYRCRGCGVVLRGLFRRCELCALPEELLHFVGVFLEVEGNFRSVERRLGISYPTVKARLASVNARLAEARLRADAGIAPGAPDDADAGPSLGAAGGAEQRGRNAGARNVEASDARGHSVHGRSERLALLRDLRAGRITVDEALRELRDA
ncbi:MAG: DUF2089 family protein [Spirochaetaceae bacterium]|nr:DUF2089 family protein [Spirochaetaceae bacterium]